MASGCGMGGSMSGLEAENGSGDGIRRWVGTGPGQRLFGTARARTARGTNTQLALQCREVVATRTNGAMDVAIGDAVADADDHWMRSGW